MKQRIIYGTMGLKELNAPTEQVFDYIFSHGIDFIDTADIYQQGRSEETIGAYLKSRPEIRSRITIQSKLGIQKPGSTFGARFNFSYPYIKESAKKILERLGTDYLDILLFHRPDPLAQRDEVYRAVDDLFSEGLIRAVGVSNMSKDQIELMQVYTGHHIVVNQLELSLKKHQFASGTVGFNNAGGIGTDFPIGTIEYCILNDVSLQAWSPLARGIFSAAGKADSQKTEAVRTVVNRLAGEYGVGTEAIVLAWLMKHPARIEPVIGTTNIERISSCLQARKIELTRDQWYELLVAACGYPMP
jgi:predicted oxidoreductase